MLSKFICIFHLFVLGPFHYLYNRESELHFLPFKNAAYIIKFKKKNNKIQFGATNNF